MDVVVRPQQHFRATTAAAIIAAARARYLAKVVWGIQCRDLTPCRLNAEILTINGKPTTRPRCSQAFACQNVPMRRAGKFVVLSTTFVFLLALGLHNSSRQSTFFRAGS